MNYTLQFVTYNAMGGHPVLSFAPDLLLSADRNPFGDAIGEIEIYAHVEPAHGPPPESDFLMARFVERLPTLPKAWFRRKKKRVEIAYRSRLGCAEALLDGDFAAKKIPDFALLRRACGEVAESLAMLQSCVKRTDGLEVGRFLSFVDAKTVELSALDDGQLLRRLREEQAAKKSRLIR